ncbi:MAG: ATP-grasp fold amidoligase family protein [Clostridia bacterium]
MGKLKEYISNPWKMVLFLGRRGLFNWMSDEKYIKIAYKAMTHKKLDLKNPTTFNEKLQWLKLNDRKDIYTTMVDKYLVKEYVKNIIGEEHIIPTIGVWDSFDKIDFDSLPDKFVLKCTHDSGGLVICNDKSKLNKEAAKAKINTCLTKNYFWQCREWPYKNVKPRIIAESYMEDNSGADELSDYKIFTFNGEPKTILTIRGGHLDESKTDRRMYDTDWNLLDVGFRGKPIVKESEPKPKELDEMLEYAKILSKDTKHLRCDFYICNGKVYFGELTFYHMSGFEQFEPEEFNTTLGNYIQL